MAWKVAQPKSKKFKFFLSGPPGSLKTRVALGLSNNGSFKDPATAVVDTEFGTEHYADQFAFRVPDIDPIDLNADTIYKLIMNIIKNPGNNKTLIIDSFSVYYDMLIEKWLDKFLQREISSPGHKQEYYNIQPRDYNHINREASKLVRALLRCDMNIICICQVKPQYEFQAGALKVVGQTADGWKRLSYYFDTLINIEKAKTGWKAVIGEKDRTHSFGIGEIIPWETDTKIVEYINSKIGKKFCDGPNAAAFDGELDSPFPTDGEDKPDVNPAAEDKPQIVDEPQIVQDQNPPSTIPPSVDETTVEKDSSPIKTETLMEALKEIRKLGFDKPELIAGVKKLYGHEKPSMMTEGEGRDIVKMIIRGEFPTFGNSAT